MLPFRPHLLTWEPDSMAKSIRERAAALSKLSSIRDAYMDGQDELRAALDIRTGGDLDTIQLDILCDAVSARLKKQPKDVSLTFEGS